MEAKTELKVAGYGGGRFTLEGVRHEDAQVLLGSFKAGHHWVRRGTTGSLEHVPSYEALPHPAVDVEMQPFWSPAGADCPVQLELFHHAEVGAWGNHSGASIIIQHLCGYDYTPEAYKKQSALLESFGFECLRSRRGRDGQFWELWFLPSVWLARGCLKREMEELRAQGKNEKEQTQAAIKFLRQHASFGTLDVSVQRLAQVMPD